MPAAVPGLQSQDPSKSCGYAESKGPERSSALAPRLAPAGGQDLRLIYPKSRADYPRCSAVECARSQRLARSLSDNSAMTSEFNELFTDTFIYSSMAVLALCAFAAMWIIRK